VSIGAAAIMGALSHTKPTYTVDSRVSLYARVQLYFIEQSSNANVQLLIRPHAFLRYIFSDTQ